MRVYVSLVPHLPGYLKLEFTNELDRRDFIKFIDEKEIRYIAEVKPAAQVTQTPRDKRCIYLDSVDFIKTMIESMPEYERVSMNLPYIGENGIEIGDIYTPHEKTNTPLISDLNILLQNGSITLNEYVERIKKL